MNKYIPAPIDTNEVELDKEIIDLSEKMARNTHEVWARGRIEDGWTYGKERNDSLKTHPCLVPYDELTETEKEYDRRTSMETLKFIRKMGYEITKTDKRKDNL